MAWKVGAARGLPIDSADSWDGGPAQDSIWTLAGFPDDPNPSKARKAFLVYDDANDEQKGGYKLPFARVINGALVASAGGLRAAAASLAQSGLPAELQTEARAVLDAYAAKLPSPAKKKTAALGPERKFSGAYETFDALTTGDSGEVRFLAATPMNDQPGFDGYLVPFYCLSDRGSFFVPGSCKKTAKEQLNKAQVLYQHYRDAPIGRFTAMAEDATGFRISAAINEGTQTGAEAMSNLRFGVPMGLSYGYDSLADRSGTDADDKLLNRKTAPDYFKSTPINELRAITDSRMWEGSLVTWPAIGNAAPDEIRSAGGTAASLASRLPSLLAALKSGALASEEETLVSQIVAAWTERAALGTRPPQTRRRIDIELDAMLMGLTL